MFGHWTLRWIAITSLVLLISCGGGGDDGGRTGTLVLSITDGPFPGLECLTAVKLKVDHIQAKGDGAWVDIKLVDPDPDGTVTIDIFQLRAGLTAALGEAEVPAGAYKEIRLRLDTAMLEFAPDTSDPDNHITFVDQPFKVPSGMSSGLKIKIDPPLLVGPGAMTEITLDVDLAGSFHTTGLGATPTCDDLHDGQTKVIFHPVVRALGESDVGMVTGLVRDGEAGVSDAQVAALPAGATDPTAIEGDPPAPKSLSAEDGGYALLLAPGEYDLWVLAEGLADWTLALPGVVVIEGDVLPDQDIDLSTLAPE